MRTRIEWIQRTKQQEMVPTLRLLDLNIWVYLMFNCLFSLLPHLFWLALSLWKTMLHSCVYLLSLINVPRKQLNGPSFEWDHKTEVLCYYRNAAIDTCSPCEQSICLNPLPMAFGTDNNISVVGWILSNNPK